ncbi:T7SS effector LXG polymorphic toxin [Listeria valentina]|uniref:T7SS effector LXG polymorphic toxin n=1 Tax=Listeria valentina TaxID=2705293 RepID=UPI001430355A|nr:T7SS effector LXG polymorphic toxin [Listeria valentina]
MSIDMYVSKSKAQATSMSQVCQQHLEGYEALQQAIHQFTGDSPLLKGKAYDSAKAFYSAVLLPLVQAGVLLTEATEEAVQKFPERYQSEVDSGDLKQSELEEQIRQADNLINQANALQKQVLQSPLPETDQQMQLKFNQALIDVYQTSKKELEDKLRKLVAFHASSPSIFSEIASLKQAIDQGIAQTKSAWNSSTGTFVVPPQEKLMWAEMVTKKVKQSDAQFLERISKKVPNLSDAERAKLFTLAQTNPDMEPPQEIIDYFMKDVDEIPKSIIDNLPQDLFNAGVESSGKAVQSFGFLLTALTGKMGPGGAGNFVMVNPSTSSLTTNLIKIGSTVAKVGKYGLPVVGGVIDGVTQITQGEDVGDAVIKSAVHVGIGFAGGEAGAAIGAAIGTAIPIPIVGTVVGGVLGFAVGVGITAVGNYVFDKIYDKKDDIIRGAKKIVDDIGEKTKEVGKSIEKGVKSVGDKIGNAASGFMKGLGSAFG